MPSESTELILTIFEYSLLLGGAGLLFRLTGNTGLRTRWLGTNRLALWPVTAGEFLIYVFLLFGSGVFFQLLAHFFLPGLIAGGPDHDAWEVCVNGAAMGLGGLAGWRGFQSMRGGWYAGYGAVPPPTPPAPRLPWAKVLLYGGGTLAAALPVVMLVNLGWVSLLQRLGWPEEPQDLLAIFQNARSPLVIAGLLVVACLLAPLYEELLFRAGLYRFSRQKLGRPAALLLSGLLFGAVHANLASFLPLSVFGMGLALAYESTGDIRVPVIAHGLFNLNTVVLLLSGLVQQP